MNIWLSTSFQLAGGIGIFLLSLDLLTQGLRTAGGNALQSMLTRWTDTPARGLFFGFAATGILQSSTVVTAIVIGLVNAAIMPLTNAAWTIFGSNIGTTLTGWLVSAVGFSLNLKLMAMPFVGTGMLLRMVAGNKIWQGAGTALAGLGLFFIGIDFLKDAFSVFAVDTDFTASGKTGWLGLLGLVGAGIVMTVLIQSSTAAIVIILTSAASGMLTLNAGAALVIGANLGTTSTAILAAIGASPNAKRTSSVHVIFNIVTAAIIFPLMHFVLDGLEFLQHLAGIIPHNVLTLAMFHTAFSVIGVIIFFPFVPTMTRFLETRFIPHDNQESQTKFLDKATAALPSVSMPPLCQELARLRCKTAQLVVTLIDKGASRTLSQERQLLMALSGNISTFMANLTQENLDADTADNLQSAVRINRHLAQCLSLTTAITDLQDAVKSLRSNSTAIEQINQFVAKVTRIFQTAATDNPIGPRVRVQLRKEYNTVKESLLQSGIHKEVSLEKASAMLDSLSHFHRMAEQMVRGSLRLARLGAVVAVPELPPQETTG